MAASSTLVHGVCPHWSLYRTTFTRESTRNGVRIDSRPSVPANSAWLRGKKKTLRLDARPSLIAAAVGSSLAGNEMATSYFGAVVVASGAFSVGLTFVFLGKIYRYTPSVIR